MSKDKKNKVTVKKTMTSDEAVAYLRDILKKFKEGKVNLSTDDSKLTLAPTDEISLEIKGGFKRGKSKLSMKLVWQEEETPTTVMIDADKEEAKPKKAKAKTKPKDKKEGEDKKPKKAAAKTVKPKAKAETKAKPKTKAKPAAKKEEESK
ncbi:MAG: hypothetical protein BA863_14520 [Desulfovibrio sp. S3730MH75]|nr:MAG: hypothetical protein BA863_14520 [Desulfovibrio sp. S3730MH75]